jgi:succinoglycan biosynthesis transport protein ExoP
MTEHATYGTAKGFDRQSSSAEALSFGRAARVVWQNKATIVLAMIVGLVVAFLLRSQIIPRYEAEAQVVLDVRSTTILKFDAVVSGLPPQPEVIHTEMDVLASRGMAERVLDHLSPADVKQLGDDGARTTPMSRFFTKTWPAMLQQLGEWVPPLKEFAESSASDQQALLHTANSQSAPDREYLIGLLMQGLKVSNDGRSYTIHIAFASPHPRIAAIVANTYADQYFANQLDMKAAATTRANELLSQRLGELRRQLEESETAVETYRRAGGMLGDKAGTIMTQQLSQTNSELAVARNQRVEAESKLAVVQSKIHDGADLQTLSDVVTSSLLQSLIAKQAELRHQEAQLKSQYTASYPNMKSVQADVAALQRQIDEETARVVAGLANQVDIARDRELQLQRDLERLEHQFGQGSEAEVKLQQLQREADANRVVYEAYLNRLKEVTEQQQLQSADAYLVSLASMPTVPSYPRYRPLLILGLAFGGLAGISLAFLRDRLDQRLRSIGQVEEITGIPVVALMPSLPWRRFVRPETYVLRPQRRGSNLNEALRSAWAAVLLGRSSATRVLSSQVMMDEAHIHPSTPGMLRRGGKVILVTSSVPSEGKTAFCLAMARSFAMDKHKVLLIDADLRRPGVARCFGDGSAGRLTDLLEGRATLSEAVRVDKRSGAHYLAGQVGAMHPQDVLSSARIRDVIEEARKCYDLILIDTPPILVGADAALLAGLADCSLFFIRWGMTSREQVLSALRRLELYHVKISGIVLSHVNLRRHARLAAGEGYYRSYGRLPGYAR